MSETDKAREALEAYVQRYGWKDGETGQLLPVKHQDEPISLMMSALSAFSLSPMRDGAGLREVSAADALSNPVKEYLTSLGLLDIHRLQSRLLNAGAQLHQAAGALQYHDDAFAPTVFKWSAECNTAAFDRAEARALSTPEKSDE